jgi:hypothetical protein
MARSRTSSLTHRGTHGPTGCISVRDRSPEVEFLRTKSLRVPALNWRIGFKIIKVKISGGE